MTTTSPTQTHVPAAGSYTIDPAHTNVEFQVRHLGLSKVRGSFSDLSGSVAIAEDLAGSSTEVRLVAESFSTGNEDRDAHVRSADFLDVANFPELVYRSTGVRADGDAWIVDGELTIRDVTRAVPLHVRFEGTGQDPWGGRRIAFTATGEIDREQFGITWNQALEAGGVLVGRTVKITLDVQAVAD